MTPTGGAQHADGGIALARAALLEKCDEASVGSHLAMHVDEHGFIVHEFTCTMAGYPHWVWTVVLAHDVDADSVTVCDAVLLPGSDALVPPQWVPWSKRIQPGDLRPGDLLPSDPNDVRLVPGFVGTLDDSTESPDALEAAWELGLGRERVLSPEGRDDAAERWWRGDTGPNSADARLAPHPCSTCGFFVSIRGALGAGFGVCSNEMSPADGRVVSVVFGCGAHSGITPVVSTASLPEVTLDETEFEIVQISREGAKEDVVPINADAEDLVDSAETQGVTDLDGASEESGAPQDAATDVADDDSSATESLADSPSTE